MKPDYKNITLNDLEKLIGKEQLQKLFLEHYVTLVGRDFQEQDVNSSNLNNIIE